MLGGCRRCRWKDGFFLMISNLEYDVLASLMIGLANLADLRCASLVPGKDVDLALGLLDRAVIG